MIGARRSGAFIGPRGALPRLLTLATGLAALYLAFATHDAPNPRSSAVVARFASGSLWLRTSKDGSAILTAGNMKPGDTATGMVTVENAGSVPATVTLSDSNLIDVPGSNGGKLSERLDLLIRDVTPPRAPLRAVFSGKLVALGSRSLGVFEAGQSRTYRFAVGFGEGGAPVAGTSGDNLYAGSSASVAYDWQASAPELLAGPCANRKLGTPRRDAVEGTPAGDRIYGRGGNDLISGLQGRDCLFGHKGADRLVGGSDADRLSGGSGKDLLSGRSGNDRLFGGPNDDELSGGSSRDRLSGNAGDDRVVGGPEGDWLSGGAGRDMLVGGIGDDRLLGGSDIDRFDGGPGADRIYSLDGLPETVRCGTGDDVVRADMRDRLTGCEQVAFGPAR